jgi:type IV secretion system protein VirB4
MEEKLMYISDFLKNQPAIEDLMPRLNLHISERVVSFIDNRMLLAIRLSGMPFESIDDAVLENRFDGLNKFFASLAKDKGSRLGIWTHLMRRKIQFVELYQFHTTFMKAFSAKYLHRFENEDYFENRFYISFVLKYDDFDEGLKEIEDLGNYVLKSLSMYDPECLTAYEKNGVWFSEVYSFIGYLINGFEETIPITPSPAYEIIPSAHLHFGYDLLEIRSENATRYATCYDLKDFPDTCSYGQFNPILSQPFEFTLTQTFICMGIHESQKKIAEQINNLVSVEDKAIHQRIELMEAQGYISSGELTFGDYCASLVVYGDTDKKAIDNGTIASSIFLGNTGARWVKATLSAPITYCSQIPNYHLSILGGHGSRSMPKSSRNLASTFGMHNYSIGKQYGNPIGDGTAVIPLQTKSKSVYHFNFHHSKPDEDSHGEKIAGHTLILGATGTGKTTLQLTLLGFLERFNPKIFAMDKDRGMEIFIRALGGTYYPLKAGEPTGLAPFQLPDTPKNRDFLYGLVTACGKDEHGKISAEEEQMIKTAVDTVYSLNQSERCFSRLLESIPNLGGNSLSERLRKWCYAGQGRFAWALDNPSNEIDIEHSQKIGFDVTDFLKDGYAPTEPVLAFLFHLKDLMQEKGGLLATIVEEFWLPAQYPTTQEKILDVLKTGRKKDEFIILVSQSPEDAINSAIFGAIRDQTPTKIYLPNPAAEYESYKRCHLTHKEFRELKALTEDSRTFLIKQGNQSAFATIDLYGFSDEIAVLSGSSDNVAILEEIIEHYGNNPDVWLPIFQERRKGSKSGTTHKGESL